jgi:hypothetical protein
LSAIHAGDIALLIRKDCAWHQMIWQACPNRSAEASLENLVQRFFPFCTICLVTKEGYDAEQDAMAELPIHAVVRRNFVRGGNRAAVTLCNVQS